MKNHLKALASIFAVQAVLSGAYASNSLKNQLFCQVEGSATTYDVSSSGPTRAVTVVVHPDRGADVVLPNPEMNAVVAGYYADLSEVKLLLADPRIMLKDAGGKDTTTPDPDSDTVFKFKVKFTKATPKQPLNTYLGSLNLGLNEQLSDSGSVVCKCKGPGGEQTFVSCPDPNKGE
jgi:hypothetical protein